MRFLSSPALLLLCFTFLLILSLCLAGCTSTEVAPSGLPIITLTVEDIGVTEVWLQINMPDDITQRMFKLTRDGDDILTSQVVADDTTIVDELLLPNRSYTYKAYRLVDTVIVDSTETVSVVTMDTSSHEITWRVETFGEAGSSILYDVAIISDTLAYAVGEIQVLDSLGQPQNPPYNVARWNGSTWEFMTLKYNCRLYFPYCGGDTLLFAPATSVCAFGPNDVWIAAGSVHHYDGIRWTQGGAQGAGSANKIWGDSPNNLWFAGNGGVLVHYDGQTWLPTGIGTNLSIWDIWGETDPKTGELVILCVASDIFQGSGRSLSRIEGSRVTTLSDSGLNNRLIGIWFEPDRHYYIVGDGIHWKRGLSSASWEVYPPGVVTSYFSSGVRGTGINDVFVCGSFMEIVHFNGLTWHSYRSDTPFDSGSIGRTAVTKNLVITVGLLGSQALAIIGTR